MPKISHILTTTSSVSLKSFSCQQISSGLDNGPDQINLPSRFVSKSSSSTVRPSNSHENKSNFAEERKTRGPRNNAAVWRRLAGQSIAVKKEENRRDPGMRQKTPEALLRIFSDKLLQFFYNSLSIHILETGSTVLPLYIIIHIQGYYIPIFKM